MNDKHRNIIGKVYQAFNNKNIEMILSLLHTSAQLPGGWNGEVVEGHDELRDFLSTQWLVITLNVKPLSIKQNGEGNVEATVHEVIKDTEGKITRDEIVRHVYTFEDDLIKRLIVQSI